MGTKIILIALISLGSYFGLSQGTEEQRKYILPASMSPDTFIVQSQWLNGLSTYFHSDYVCYDIYIDNSDYLLYENGFSLRFRKKIIADTLITYTFQLKSEMIHPDDVRMEIEETELDFYRVLDGEKWIPLPSILDHLFAMEDLPITRDPGIFNHFIELLNKWIEQKADAPIAPFQKLKFLDSAVFTSNALKTFSPVLIGISQRNRGHVYIDTTKTTDDLKNIPMNKLSLNDRPAFFIENPQFNWILETSMDNSKFRSTYDSNSISLVNEYEVERKYFNPEKGTELLKRFEKELIETLGCKVELASKYSQSIREFLEAQKN